MLWRKYSVGRSRSWTLQTSNLGRRLMTRLRSEPLTRASRRRKVKMGTMSVTREVRISGHMLMMRRNSTEVRGSVEVIKSTVDLRSGREADMIGGWWLIKDRKSRPIESR